MTLTATDAQGRVLGTIGAAGGKLAASNPGVQDIADAAVRRTGSVAAAARALAGFTNGYVTISASGKKPATAFQASSETEAIELAATSRVPLIRGAADTQMARTAPGVITVQHKSSGMRVGKITPQGAGYGATHSDGKNCPPSGSQQGALAGLIAYHNKMAAMRNAKMRDTAQAAGAGFASVKGYAGDVQETLDFAYLPAVTSSDGPRVTALGTGKAPAAVSKPGVPAGCARVYAKLRGKGMGHGQALSLAKRAAAMNAKAGKTPKA